MCLDFGEVGIVAASAGQPDSTIDAVSRLARAETNPACLSQHLRRVELHADCIHLVLKRPGLAGQTRDAQTDIAAIERRLAPGERLLVEETDPALVRVVLPVRLKLRGGRSWMALPDGKSGARKANADTVLIQGLSGAHAALDEMSIRPDGRAADQQDAKSPPSAYRRRLANLAFLSPDIQAAIVAGQQPAGLKLEHFLRSDLPLAWADQRIQYGF